MQSAIWQVASNLNVTSINHDTAFDLLVDNLSGSHPSNYFNSFSDGGYDYELITPVPVRDSRGRLLAATQSFVFATGAPEPASWALMIGGFGLAGVALRRRRGAAAV